MQARPDAPQLSVVIITLNEETRLLQCLQSLPRGSEIVVLDSGSQDRTCELARSLGARVESRAFDNYADQKNAAVRMATRPWVLSLDADEVMDSRLATAVAEVTSAPAVPEAGFRVRRRLVFMGRTLRFGKASDRPLRLFRQGHGVFSGGIHEQVAVRGAVGRLPGVLWHNSYADLTDYFRRFNLYTSRIAENHASKGRAMPWGPVHVLRPLSEFISRYFLRLGCLDGYPGYTYALLSSLYTYVKYAKLKELLAVRPPAAETKPP